MGKQYKGLLYLPTNTGLPGMTERQIARLREGTPNTEWAVCEDKDAVVGALPDLNVAIVWRFTEEWRRLAPNLRLVTTPAAGQDLIQVKPGPDLEVWFSGFHGELMGETAVGLMLAFTRGIRASIVRLAREPWPRKEISDLQRPLRGSRVTILGFGHIGKWAGRLAKPFGVTLTGVNRRDMTRPDYFDANDSVQPIDKLDSVLPSTDHLVMVLPGNAEADRIMDARRIALLPKNAIVYNIGRGNALDLDALVRALDSGAIAGAGLDVFPEEPLPDDAPIRRCDNVILMPHVSAFAPNYMDLYLNEVLPKLRKLFPD